MFIGDGANSGTFVSLSDDVTLANTGAVSVIDVTCTDCINATEIEDIYVLNSGDTLTGELVADDLGIEFTPGDALTDCSTFAATGGGIFYDDSEGVFKKCQDNTLTDLDTGGAETNTLETTITGIEDTEVFVGDGSNSGTFVPISGDATLANTGALTVIDVTCTDCINATEIEDIYALVAGDTFTGTVTTDDLVVDGVLDTGTRETFTDSDTTPDVGTGSFFITNTSGVTITDFDGAGILAGQVITVESNGAIVFDCTSSGFQCGSTDITTAAGDLTSWLYDGTDWHLIAFTDQSTDMGTDSDTDEVGTLTTGDICINDGSSVNCTVNSESELETALDALDVVTVTTDDVSSANMATAISDETGSGVVVFGTSPTIATPSLTLQQGAAPTPTAEGDIQWETDDDHLMIGDGTDAVVFVPTEDVSGDATMDTAGAVTIASDSVALNTDTTGNYVASITNGSGITGGDGGSEGAALTLAATLGTDIVPSELDTTGGTAADSDNLFPARLTGSDAFDFETKIEHQLAIGLNDGDDGGVCASGEYLRGFKNSDGTAVCVADQFIATALSVGNQYWVNPSGEDPTTCAGDTSIECGYLETTADCSGLSDLSWCDEGTTRCL